jgi:Rrf2 family protein
MKMSTKARYGLRFMIDLAMQSGMSSVPLKDVARRQNISEKYLWQVVTPLKKAGRIQTSRGARGGFILALAPENITAFDVVTLLEGKELIVACVAAPAACARSPHCAARDVWRELAELMAATLRGVTLKMLADKQQLNNQVRSVAYDI